MTSTLTLPEPVELDVELEQRRTLGGGTGPDRIRDRVTIGRADALLLDPASPGLDPEVVARLEADAARFSYFALHLTCSFRPGDDPIVESAVSVLLALAEGTAGDDPKVHSLDPEKLATPVKHTRTLAITPKLTIVPEVVELEAGGERAVEFERQEHYLVATGEGESIAQWDLRTTRAVDLVGMHRLVLVAKVPAGLPARAEIALQAKVRRRFGGLVPYNANLDPSEREVALAPIA